MASPGFGFSVGDFIAGVTLVKKLIQALNESTGSRTAYRHLISELSCLDNALTGISQIQFEPAQLPCKIALEKVVSQCQLGIESFLDKNSKFRDSLGINTGSPLPRWRINLHKIQWALFTGSSVQALRTEIQAHTTTLNLLLSTFQMSDAKSYNQTVDSCKNLIGKAHNQTNETLKLAKQNHQLLAVQSELIVSISSTVAQKTETGEVKSLVAKILESNMRVFATVLQIQQVLSEIPAQVNLQQPVILEDAHGRLAPFHIEFINSFTVFQAVLEARFHDVPGFKKVRNGEYMMQDVASKKTLDFTQPWESVFRPGRRANMSMVFEEDEAVSSVCPGCWTENISVGDGTTDDIHCPNQDCGIWYRRVTEINPAGNDSARKPGASTNTKLKQLPFNSDETDENDADGADENVHDFHRVQIVHRRMANSSRGQRGIRAMLNGTKAERLMAEISSWRRRYDKLSYMIDGLQNNLAVATDRSRRLEEACELRARNERKALRDVDRYKAILRQHGLR